MKPVRNPSVQSKLLPDGHVVLFSDEHDWAHTLSPLAGIAWEFCDGNYTVDEIVENVCSTAGLATADSIKPEIASLFESLSQSGLLN